MSDTVFRAASYKRFRQPKTPEKFWEWVNAYLRTGNSVRAAQEVYLVKYKAAASYGTDNMKLLKELPSIKRLVGVWRDRKPQPHAYNSKEQREQRYQAWVKEFEDTGNATVSASRVYEVFTYSHAGEIGSHNLHRYKDENHGITWGNKDIYSKFCQLCGEESEELQNIKVCEPCLERNAHE